MEKVRERNVPNVETALSLASASLIIVGALMPLLWLQYSGIGMGWMWGGPGMMPGMWGAIPGISLIGIVSGALVLLGAIMMNYKPMEAKKWGTLVLVFAAISLLAMGGFFIGAILGIIGGIMAISKQ